MKEKQFVWLVIDDSGYIIDVFDSEQKANELWEELSRVTPRSSFYYEVEKHEVH